MALSPVTSTASRGLGSIDLSLVTTPKTRFFPTEITNGVGFFGFGSDYNDANSS
jgi:hypothetical protein